MIGGGSPGAEKKGRAHRCPEGSPPMFVSSPPILSHQYHTLRLHEFARREAVEVRPVRHSPARRVPPIPDHELDPLFLERINQCNDLLSQQIIDAQGNLDVFLERVANRRMAHLATAFQELGMPEHLAKNRARLTYSAYLGFLQLQRQNQTPNLSSEEFDAYIEHVIKTLIPESSDT